MNILAMRRTWFQVHKWIGLILAILIVPLCVSGALLVWDEPLDRIASPARHAVSGDTLLAPQVYAQAAARVLEPGERIAMLTLPEGDGPVIVAATAGGRPAERGRPPRAMIYLDPPTARVLEVASGGAGLVRFLHVLHGSLLLPGIGRQVVGWTGVAMMVSCFTGLWLWWPTVGRWARGLRWRRHRDTDTNLHYLLGFWVALPLFVLSLTGVWIAFPQVFGASAHGTAPDRAAQARARPLATTGQSLPAVIARARTLREGELRFVTWPTDLRPDWSIAFADAKGRPVTVLVADDTGTTSAAPARAPDGMGGLMRRIHDGTGMGRVWQVVIFLGGLLPAVLAVTGVIMWWRARGWNAALAAKRTQTAEG